MERERRRVKESKKEKRETDEFKSYLLKVADRIRKERIKKKITAEQLALDADIGKETMSRIEVGKGNPTIGVLFHISRGLRVSVDSLLKE